MIYKISGGAPSGTHDADVRIGAYGGRVADLVALNVGVPGFRLVGQLILTPREAMAVADELMNAAQQAKRNGQIG